MKNEMDWISQDGNQMTGLTRPVAMAAYRRWATGLASKRWWHQSAFVFWCLSFSGLLQFSIHSISC